MKKRYGMQCYRMASSEILRAGVHSALCGGADTRLLIDFTFYPPHNRNYDEDNLIARMKAGLDGLARAIGVNDSTFKIGKIDRAPVVPGGQVRLHISVMREGGCHGLGASMGKA
ncbi:endonuclease [Alcaligenaceae bacterium B3P038]|nr:endonuclease [Alcaligenaceae bacterium B3P038]